MQPVTFKQFNSVTDAMAAGYSTLDGGSTSARLDAELLLAIALGQSRAWLYANPDAALTEKQAQVFAALLTQRAAGRPVAQLTGKREFWSLDLAVTEFTLVPRPETETLVEQALQYIPANKPQRILDLGTGSGAIAIALACERPAARLVATDISSEALATAQDNATRHCPGRIDFLRGDWYLALPEGIERFDVIVANPPYVAENDAGLTDPELAFEPADALYSGKDGLTAIRAIVAGAASYLRPGGRLLLEHGFAQAQPVQHLLRAAGFAALETVADLAGQPRVSHGQRP